MPKKPVGLPIGIYAQQDFSRIADLGHYVTFCVTMYEMTILHGFRKRLRKSHGSSVCGFTLHPYIQKEIIGEWVYFPEQTDKTTTLRPHIKSLAHAIPILGRCIRPKYSRLIKSYSCILIIFYYNNNCSVLIFNYVSIRFFNYYAEGHSAVASL